MNVTQGASTSSMRPCLSSLRKLSLAMRPTAARSSGLMTQAIRQQSTAHGTRAYRQLSSRSLFPAAQHALQHQQQHHAAARRMVAASASAPAVADQPSAAAAAQQHSQPATGNGVSGKSGAVTAPTFQEAVKRLQDYWSAQGCIVWLPHNTEVGAGTMNPATFLR